MPLNKATSWLNLTGENALASLSRWNSRRWNIS